jgi:hypothetical protein
VNTAFLKELPGRTACCGVICAPVAIALVLFPTEPWVRLVGAFLLACVPPGAMIMCWVDSGEATTQACLTVLTSLSCLALTGATMIWLSAWHPNVALYGLAGASVVSCGARLMFGGRQ